MKLEYLDHHSKMKIDKNTKEHVCKLDIPYLLFQSEGEKMACSRPKGNVTGCSTDRSHELHITCSLDPQLPVTLLV